MYIRSTGIVSPQASFNQLLSEPAAYAGDKLSCIEPDYSAYVDPKQIRRMSRIIKMGVAAALSCLKEAGATNPDAIITGTAYGCLADTDIFLSRMVENKEELLSPTAFIQSTHNTVGAQIALLLKCHNYNNTYVHRGFSFESALLDGITLMEEEVANEVLVGAVDEITATSHAILQRFGLYRKQSANSLHLLKERATGTLNGEGAAFFLLGREKGKDAYAKLDGLSVFYKPGGIDAIREQIQGFLDQHDVQLSDIGLVITGRNGDAAHDAVYDELQKDIFHQSRLAAYKHLCGEYPTSSGFALWLAANILKSGTVPAIMDAGTQSAKKILVYTHYKSAHHALYLVSSC